MNPGFARTDPTIFCTLAHPNGYDAPPNAGRPGIEPDRGYQS